MTFAYRTASGRDAMVCAQIIREWGAATEWMDPLDDLEPMAASWVPYLEADSAWVAEQDGKVVGFCAREDNNIDGLYVASDAQSRGVGKALLDLAKADCNWISVWVYEKNQRAWTFYQREGLVEVGREKDEHSDLIYIESRWDRAA